MFTDKQRNIFRKKALDRLSSPEQLDQLIQVVSPMEWLPLAALGGLVLGGLLWSIFGRIPITVTGQGVLVLPRRVVEFQSPISGQLQSLDIQPGQCIEKDRLLATIDPRDLKQQLQQQQDKLAQLQRQATDTTELMSQRTQQEREAIASTRASLEQRLRNARGLTPVLREQGLNAISQQRESLSQRLENTQALTPILKDKGLGAIAQQRLSLQQRLQDARELTPVYGERLEKRRELLAEGAITEDSVLQAEQEYRQAQQNIFDLEAQLKQLDVSEAEAEERYLQNSSTISEIQVQLQELEVRETEARQQYLDNLSTISQLQADLQELDTREKRLAQDNLDADINRENQIQEVSRQIAILAKQVADNSQIVSTQGGCVLEITATVGQIVNPGTPLGTMNTQVASGEMVGVTYFAVRDGKQIEPGMEIQITPDTVQRQRFGAIVGTITTVSPFPVTPEGAISVVGNRQVVENIMTQRGPQIEAIASLQLDPATFSGYKWSSSSGPELPISAGTTTTARVRIEERSPITFILPIFREWSGLD